VSRALPDRCPICSEPNDPGRSSYPFCSDRCKAADLYHWLSGDYQVPGLGDGPDEQDEQPVREIRFE